MTCKSKKTHPLNAFGRYYQSEFFGFSSDLFSMVDSGF
jgi:hypothetical protein